MIEAKKNLFFFFLTVGEIIWSPADFVCLPTDKEIISLSF